jgi:hypothetical protein
MTLAFLTVSRYVEDTLRAAPALAAGDIQRSRERRVVADSDAAVRIYPQNAAGQAAAVRGGFHRWEFELSVECLVRAPLAGADAGDAEAAAAVLVQAVWQRLAAAVPPAGVQSLLNNPRLQWEPVDGGERAQCCATLTFSVELSTNNQTLALWG